MYAQRRLGSFAICTPRAFAVFFVQRVLRRRQIPSLWRVPRVMMRRSCERALMNWGRFMRTVMFRYYRIRHPGHRSGKDFLGEISFMIEHSSESSDDRDHDFFIDDVS